MAKCVSEFVIGGTTVPSDDVLQALRDPRTQKAKGRLEQLAASYAALKNKPSYEAWEKWYTKQQKGVAVSVTKKDIFGDQELGEIASKQATKLLQQLKKSNLDKLSPEAKSRVNAIKKAIKRRNGLTAQQVADVLRDVNDVIKKDDRINKIKKLQAQAKKNVGRKGTETYLKLMGIDMLNINPWSLNKVQLAQYHQIMDRLGSREAVIEVDNTLLPMMQSFQKGINDTNYTAHNNKKKTTKKKEDDSEMKNAFIQQILSMQISPTKLARAARDTIQNLKALTAEDLQDLTLAQLKNLSKGIAAMNNGMNLSYEVNDIIDQIVIDKAYNVLDSPIGAATAKVVFGPIQRLFARARAGINNVIFDSKTNWVAEAIRSNPLAYLDHVLQLDGMTINGVTFNKLAVAFEQYNSRNHELRQAADKAEDTLNKHFKDDDRKIFRSKAKIYLYQLVREYNANPGVEGIIDPLLDLQATIDSAGDTLKSAYKDKEKKALEELRDEFLVDGQLSEEKLLNSLSKVEKDVLKVSDKMYWSVAGRAKHLVQSVHRDGAPLYKHYVAKNRVGLEEKEITAENFADAEFYDQIFSVSSGNVERRAQKTGAALKFDPIQNSYRAARGILMDFYMTPAVRQVKGLTQKLRENHKTGVPGEITKGLDAAINEVLINVFNASVSQASLPDKFMEGLVKNAYRMVLAGPIRAIAEILSNLGFIIFASPKAFQVGMDYAKMANDPAQSVGIMQNVKSTTIGKLWDSGQTGKYADQNLSSAREGGVDSINNTRFRQFARQTKRLTGYSALSQAAGNFADSMISKPDQWLGRPLWFGSFVDKYRELNNGKDPDFAKIKANDEKYMNDNAEIIEQARQHADKQVIQAGAATNPFQTIIATQQGVKGSFGLLGIMKNANAYMSRFLLFEITTMMKGVAGMMGRNELTPRQGLALTSAGFARMSLYMPLIDSMWSMLFNALGYEDDDDDEKGFWDRWKRSMLGSMLDLMINRNLLFFPKLITNYGIEKFNEEFLEDFRDGEEYDQYDHSLVFAHITEKDLSKGVGHLITKIGGKYGPLLKILNNLSMNIDRVKKTKNKRKKEEAREQAYNESFRDFMGLIGLNPGLYRPMKRYMDHEKYNKKKKK